MEKNQTMVKPMQRSSIYWAFTDSFELVKRSLRHIFRNADQAASVVLTPIMFLLLFRYVFGGAIETGGTSYVNFLMAGIIIQTAAFGATTTAIGVANDMQRGIIDRFKSLPMLSSAVLTGHVVADLVRNTLSTIVMILVGFLVGFRPEASAIEWVYVFGLLLLFTLAFSWLSVILGLMAKSIEAVQLFSFIFIFPLTFASSAFVPTDGMPYVLRVFAENQPVTQVIEALRAWLVGTPIGDYGWKAALWCTGILVISYAIATRLFASKTTR